MDLQQTAKSLSLEDGISTVKHCFNNALDFSGRAARSEYWYFFAFNIAAAILANIVGSLVFSYLGMIVGIVLLLPGIAVSIRRLHDLDRPGWFLLLALVPIVGFILLLYWFTQRGTVGPNQYGPDPLPAAIGHASLAQA